MPHEVAKKGKNQKKKKKKKKMEGKGAEVDT